MTQDEIRAIALEVAKERRMIYTPMINDEPADWEEFSGGDVDTLSDFCTSFLAAIAEKAEPFGVWHQGDTEDESDFFLGDSVDGSCCDRCTPLYTHPAIEPAPSEFGVDQRDKDWTAFKSAAPLPDEVAQMVERIDAAQRRQDWRMCVPPEPTDTDMVLRDCKAMIERLARQVPPDCVVVQREVTEEGKRVLATHYRTYQAQWDALIAAGEVK